MSRPLLRRYAKHRPCLGSLRGKVGPTWEQNSIFIRRHHRRGPFVAGAGLARKPLFVACRLEKEKTRKQINSLPELLPLIEWLSRKAQTNPFCHVPASSAATA